MGNPKKIPSPATVGSPSGIDSPEEREGRQRSGCPNPEEPAATKAPNGRFRDVRSQWHQVCFAACVLAAAGWCAEGAKWQQPDRKACPNLYMWSDTCNVYVLKDDDAAILIDLGDASILEHLTEIGVARVEWVLFTHHHREQGQGFPLLKGRDAKTAAPAAERAFFEKPTTFRKVKPTLDGERYGQWYDCVVDVEK